MCVPVHTYIIVSAFKIPSVHYCCIVSRIDKRGDNGAAVDPRACTLRQTFGPPGKQPLLFRLRKLNTQVFLNDFEAILHLLFYVYPFFFSSSSSCSWFIQPFYFICFFVGYFFSFTLFCLPLFRRLHSSRKHLLRVYPADANNAAITVHHVHLLYDHRRQ